MLTFSTMLDALCNDLSIESFDVRILQSRLRNEGPAFLTIALPLLDRVLLDALEQGALCKHRVLQSLHVTHFRWKGNFPTLFRGLFERIFDETGRVLPKNLIDPYAIYCIRQICGYFYKLALDIDDSVQIRKEQEFVLTDMKLNDSVDFVYAEELRKVLETNYKELTTLQFGDVLHTTSVKAPSGTFSSASSDNRIESVIPWYLWKDNICPPDILDDSFYFAYAKPKVWFSELQELGKSKVAPKVRGVPAYDVTRSLVPIKVRERKISDIPSTGLDLRHISELKFVPKDSRGPRTIVREPAHTLPIQMAYFTFLTSYLEAKTKHRVNFSDQSINRELAKRASVTKAFSTLDLKDASDRVSARLVHVLFRNCPALRYFLKFRTPHCSLPCGGFIKLSKLAGMGSGFTFATMAFIIHLTVSHSISKHLRIPYKKASRFVYVYGDDIVVPSHLIDVAICSLEKVGLRVNVTKSFSRSHFRESCGGDYYNGNEVSPVRLKLTSGHPRVVRGKFLSWSKGSKDSFINQLCMHSHELVKAGLLTLSSYLYSRIEKSLKCYLPVTHKEDLPYLRKHTLHHGKIPRIVRNDKHGHYLPVKLIRYDPVASSSRNSPESVLSTWLRDHPPAPQWWSKLWIIYDGNSQVSTNRVNKPRMGILREITVSGIEFL